MGLHIKSISEEAGLTPDTWVDGELFLEQSSELEEEVEVGVMGTALLLARRIKHKKGQSVVQVVVAKIKPRP